MDKIINNKKKIKIKIIKMLPITPINNKIHKKKSF